MKLTRIIQSSFIAIFILILTACGAKQATGPLLGEFTFTDQNGADFGVTELAGNVWIADFIFTDCETVCPPMTAEMAALQKRFKEDGIAVEFVSFTVDPTVDDASTLKKYITRFTDDESNWHLLTGYSQEEIEKFAREKFQTIVLKPETSSQVIHGTSFYLIDRNGIKINEYNFVDPTYVDSLIKEIKKLK